MDLKNLNFNNNSAQVSGGAIQWHGKKPVEINVKFLGNTAGYGDNIASFSCKLESESGSQIGSAPGQPFKIPSISVQDHYNVRVSTDYESIALISVDSNYTLIGASNIASISGFLNFSELKISGLPSDQVNLTVSASFMQDQSDPTANPNSKESLKFQINLRPCIIGEEFINKDSCNICLSGTYNIKPGAKCETCPSGATCVGGLQAIKGYWRSGYYSSNFFKCPYEPACLADGLNKTGICEKGYKGNCCHSCLAGYMKTFESECRECLSKAHSGTILAIVLLADVFLMVIMTRSSLQDAFKEQSITSTYYKIFLNYCQFISLSISLNFSWPSAIHQIFVVQQRATGGAEQFVVLDCFIPEYFEPVYVKLILLSGVPLFCLVFTIFIWKIISCFKSVNYIKEKIIGSIVVQIFFFQPSIVKYTFSMFNCIELDPGTNFLNDNLDIECWKKEHLIYSLAVALPSLMIWCVVLPCWLLIILRQQRNNLGQINEMLKYGFLYKEFKEDKFYWEIFTMFRKLLMICANVFLKKTNIIVQGLITFFIILIGFLFQDRLKPYKYDQLNKMENWSILASAITIYTGMMYIEGVSDSWSIFLQIVLITTNLLFMVYWAYYAFGYYIGKCYLRFPIFKRFFRGSLDKWANTIVPENFGDLNETVVFDKTEAKVDCFFTEDRTTKNSNKFENFNASKLEIAPVKRTVSLESDPDKQ